MKKIITIISCLTLFVSCNNLKEKNDVATETPNITSSKQKTEEEQLTTDEDYKSLEGTPFGFNETNYTGGNYTACSRKLFGSDIIKVLSDYEFSSPNGAQYPRISRLNEDGYLKVHAQAGADTYFGNMKVSTNGEFVYFDAYIQDWTSKNYNRTQVKMKLTPIQIPDYPFQIEIEIEQYGKLVIKEKLTIIVPSGD
ncbi:hypothetical protein FCR2A7T_20050 [Flavobacterium cauense R2A-7]|uniref:Uncharacterized protein n=1 Tax=Flavobacterium cauense R2A-7 TaxID=1341154 RepID=V6RY25_9FLAO|nr:hypothetical protein [Flavobacterium cauense]ESU19391.1 hypothetical protein FCR2A7T_20050 [Flavobacterium cauense R2A-7]KGO80355.1 hypothetical protein Q762_12015 [Flavobacterium cauense R2A-7]TWI09359.1 hypothetical protein IP98_02521 [Flavobacterium cauense R2A-7]